jgi:hypothetical protein
MNPLILRKKLLIAESELNRAQLFQEWQTMAAEANALSKQAKTLGFIASTGVLLVSGAASLWQKKSAPAVEKTSWLQTILNGAQLASSLWSEFRAPKTTPKT